MCVCVLASRLETVTVVLGCARSASRDGWFCALE